MKNISKIAFTILVQALFLSGCGVITPLVRNESKINRLQVGQSRKEVIDKIGYPDDVKASEGPKRIDEYRLFKPSASAFNAVVGPFFLTTTWWTPWLGSTWWTPYWVEYNDGKVIKFGHEIDWNPNLKADITVHQR